MKKHYFSRLFLVFASIILLFPGITSAERVRYVIDGDTVILDNNQHVRLIGVDTPEVKSERRRRSDYYAEEAKDFTRRMAEGKDVRLEGENEEFDKYGRRLAYIYLPDGTFLNREIVRLGYGEAIRYFPYKYKKEFLELESEARAAKLGVWGMRKSRPWWKIW